MKKHIIGLTLFSLIVSAAAIVYAVFNVPKIFLAPAPPPVSRVEKILEFQKEDNTPRIAQAVYNVKTKTLSWKLNSTKPYRTTALHWFIENEKGVQKVLSLNIEDESGEIKISPQSLVDKMLRDFPKSNQYLITDTNSKYTISDQLHSPFAFDSAKAFPVTIDYDK